MDYQEWDHRLRLVIAVAIRAVAAVPTLTLEFRTAGKPRHEY